jgi:anti-sigma factor RsiW
MTTCKTIQPRLTAYLDGELTDERGSVVRGHLRECEGCRLLAREEAALRDGLRALPPVDPPSTLWAGVQAQLAAAEVADARAPRWRRVVARWMPAVPRFAAGGLVAAAAVAMVYWRTHRVDDVQVAQAEPPVGPAVVIPVPRTEAAHAKDPGTPAGDVTDDLLAEAAQTTASYGSAIEELMKLASSARAGWGDQRSAAFDARVAALRDELARAAPGRPPPRPAARSSAPSAR